MARYLEVSCFINKFVCVFGVTRMEFRNWVNVTDNGTSDQNNKGDSLDFSRVLWIFGSR